MIVDAIDWHISDIAIRVSVVNIRILESYTITFKALAWIIDFAQKREVLRVMTSFADLGLIEY